LGLPAKSSRAGSASSPGRPDFVSRRWPVNGLFNGCCYQFRRTAGVLAPGSLLMFLRRQVSCGRSKMAVDLSMSVLVVDDYNTMIRIIRNLLKQLGFENIDDASDGSAALNKMRSKKYGLVISDWNMEPMTGYDLLREVRADPNLATTPFIMITAESKTENVIAAKKAGVNNYIVKPFNAATLKTKIEAVFPDLANA
jgi:two-component system chemotaxis response regulator CheY